MELSLSDVTSVMEVAKKVDPNPVSLAGRMVGFSSEEQQAGVPTWAWVALGLGAGAVVALVVAPRVRRLLSNSAPWLSQGGKGPTKSKKVFGRWD
jgi:hypothetical protein